MNGQVKLNHQVVQRVSVTDDAWQKVGDKAPSTFCFPFRSHSAPDTMTKVGQAPNLNSSIVSNNDLFVVIAGD